MDLLTVSGYRLARDPADLHLADGETWLAGGTWLFSEPQTGCTGVVDLTTMPWPHLEFPDAGGLSIGATCPIGELAALQAPDRWRARPLFRQCADALLSSWKIQGVATVGGNVCRAFAAASMITLCVTLDGVAEVWRPDGTAYHVPVADLVTGNGTTALRPGELLRSLVLPEHALRARTAFRKIALVTLGRSGAVLTGRVDEDGTATFAITAATAAPTVLRYPALPTAAELRTHVDAVTGWYTDALGTADWRRGVSAVLLEEVRAELSAA